MILKDLEYPDDLTLIYHCSKHTQEKTQRLEAVAALTGLRINKAKTRIMKVKTNNSQTVTVTNGSIDEVEEFT